MFGPIKNIVFDLEGTLINSLKTVVKGIAKSIEIATGQTIDPQMLPLGRSPAMIIRDMVPETKWDAALAYWENFEANIEKNIEVYPGVEELLNFLKEQKVFTAIFTSRDRLGTTSILEQKGWIPAFFDYDRLRCGDDPTGRKPSPQPLIDLCEKYALKKKETLMVGDTSADAQAAKSAGVLFGAAMWDLPGCDTQTFRSRYSQAWNMWNDVELTFRLTSPLSLKEYFLSKAP